jgi:RimJ/RimL family protein N-acetyltransferase
LSCAKKNNEIEENAMGKKRSIIQIDHQQVSPLHSSFFNVMDPALLRCFAVLNGDTRGLIFTDCLEEPSWVVVGEAAFGNLYMGGDIHYPSFRRLLGRLRHHGDVRVSFCPNDPRWQLLPHRPDEIGIKFDFSERLPHADEYGSHVLPAGFKLQPMDRTLIQCSAARDLYSSMFGNTEQALKKGFGLCLTCSGEVLSEAFAGPAAHGYYQVGAATQTSHRRKGYATFTCSRLLAQIEQQGYRTYWCCAERDQASIALARKLGYKPSLEYHLEAQFNRYA